jgi:hypothetical protein
MNALLWRLDALLYRRGFGPLLLVLGVVLQGLGLGILAALVMAATSGTASATIINGINGAAIEYVSGGAVISDGSGVSFQGRTWDVPSGRTVRATDTNAQLKIGGNTIGVNAARTMTPTAIGAASALALKALPWAAAGVALWDLWNTVRVHPDEAGGLLKDAGVAPTTTSATCFRSFPAPYPSGAPACYTSAISAFTADAPYRENILDTAETAENWTLGALSCGTGSSPTCTALYSRVSSVNGASLGMGSFTMSYSSVTGSQTSCPASVDPFDSAYSIAAGQPVGVDGKCQTARYYHTPITESQAADWLEATDPPTGVELSDMAQDAIARGQEIEASERTLNGPASVSGTPTTTTTTNPDASTVTTTKTPTTNYTYTTNTVNYTTTTVTVVNNAGDITTTTTTEGEPPESDQCKKNPDSVGCAKLGDPGTDKPAWETRDVLFTPEDLGFGAGSCPASNTWEVGPVTLTWGYEPVCDVAPMIRVALLLMASIGAIGIIFKETSA